MTEAKNKNLDFESFMLLSSVIHHDSFNQLWDLLIEKLENIREKGELEKFQRILKKIIFGLANNASFTELNVINLVR